VFGACLIGALNFIFMTGLGGPTTRWLTNDERVIEQCIKVLPVIATFQLFDSMATTLNGTLRGLGGQGVGSLVTMFCYYIIGMPISFAAAFWLHWEIIGLWTGIAVALCLQVIHFRL
jgi:MATE family multidrug resistance protein